MLKRSFKTETETVERFNHLTVIYIGKYVNSALTIQRNRFFYKTHVICKCKTGTVTNRYVLQLDLTLFELGSLL